MFGIMINTEFEELFNNLFNYFEQQIEQIFDL